MSFKERIIDHCENKMHQMCMSCAFHKPCNRISENRMPCKFYDDEFDMMEEYSRQHMREVGDKLATLAGILADSSADRLADKSE